MHSNHAKIIHVCAFEVSSFESDMTLKVKGQGHTANQGQMPKMPRIHLFSNSTNT